MPLEGLCEIAIQFISPKGRRAASAKRLTLKVVNSVIGKALRVRSLCYDSEQRHSYDEIALAKEDACSSIGKRLEYNRCKARKKVVARVPLGLAWDTKAGPRGMEAIRKSSW